MQKEVPLHPIERKFLRALQSSTDWITVDRVSSESGLSLDQTRRALEWLKEKGLVETKEKSTITYRLGKVGEDVMKNGLPERRIVNFLEKNGGKARTQELAKELGKDFSPALGRARRNGWIRIEGNQIELLDQRSLHAKEPEELALEKLSPSGILQQDLSKEQVSILDELSKRQRDFILKNENKQILLHLSESGSQLELEKTSDEISGITPEVLRSGEWKTHNLREIVVTSKVPKIYPGRRHPVRIFIDEVRENFVSLGFEEIYGSMAQSAFWNFDALFIPQQHPAREIQDTFYVKDVKADLSKYRSEVESVRSVHETGGDTGSLGWNYAWSEEEARRVVLRTHTTAVTISYLSRAKPEEARVFTVSRVFRNEKPTYKNNPEFYQIDGVMVGEALHIRNLIFMISKFYAKLGFEGIKFWPTFFPYTEPSLQTMVYQKENKRWMELGGMGVFRPEVTLPLGVSNRVLAWGLGLDRLVKMRYGLEDIRQLYGANLGWLRQVKIR